MSCLCRPWMVNCFLMLYNASILLLEELTGGVGVISRALPVTCFDGLAHILSEVEVIGVWPHGLLGASIAMIPEVDDATPSG